jgi:hypothetical protein
VSTQSTRFAGRPKHVARRCALGRRAADMSARVEPRACEVPYNIDIHTLYLIYT